MARGEVRYRLVLDAGAFESGLRKAEAVFKAVVTGSVVAAAKRFVDAQSESEGAINALNLALANQGRFTEATSGSLQKLASELQSTTKFTDESVLSASAMLASFGMNEAQIKRTTRAAADFAQANRKDVVSSAELLGKAFAGNTASLSRYGIVIDESVPKSERFAKALEQIERRFGGAAQAGAGQLTILQHAFGNTEEALGKLLGQMLGADKPFAGIIGFVQELNEFIGVKLVLALSEARVKFLEFLQFGINFRASALEKLARFGELTGAPGSSTAKTQQMAAEAREYAKALDLQIEKEREAGNVAALAAGNLLKFENANRTTTDEVEKLTEALKRQKKALEAVFNFVGPMPPTNIEKLLGGSFARAQMDFAQPATDLVSPQALKALYEVSGLYTVINQKTGLWTRYQDVVNQELENAATITEKISSGGLMGSLAKLPSIILNALQGGGNVGKSIGASLGSDLGTGLGEKVGPTLMKALGPAIGGALGAALPGIGAALGSVAGDFIGKFLSNMTATKGKIAGALLGGPIGFFLGGFLGGQAEQKRINDMRDQFISAAGGIDVLRQKAFDAGLGLERLLSAKKVQDFQSAIEQLQGAFDLQGQAQKKLNDAVEEFGFTFEELGPKLQQQRLDEMALGLLEKFELLTASGIDTDVVLARMAGSFSTLVQNALKTGMAIPTALQGPIEKLLKMGLLTDEAGNKIEDLGELKFETPESLGDLIQAIRDLVNALNGIKPNYKFTVDGELPGGPGRGGDGRDNDGDPTKNYDRGGIASGPMSGYWARLHGREAVVPLDNLQDAASVLAQIGGGFGVASGETVAGVASGEAVAAIQSLAEAVAEQRPINVDYKPSIILEDRSLVRTVESVREFEATVLRSLGRELRGNQYGLVSEIKRIVREELGRNT